MLTDRKSSTKARPRGMMPALILLMSMVSGVPAAAQERTVNFTPAYINENRNTQKFLIPETYELANVIIALTPYGINDKRRVYQDSEYYQRVKAHFWKYRDHPIVTKLNMRSDADIGTYMSFRENGAYWRFDGDRIVRDTPYLNNWNDPKNAFAENRALVEDFAKTSDFRKFFAQNKPYYDQLTKDFQAQAPLTSMIQWLEANFGGGLRYDAYKVIFSPLINRTHSANRGETANFKESLMFVGAPHIFGKNDLAKIEVARMIFTEIDHNFVNPTSDKHLDAINKAMSNVAWWNRSEGYDNPYATFNEYATWSVFSLWAKDQYKPDDYAHFLKLNRYDMISRGFPRFMEYDKELVRLYDARQPGQSVADFYPAIIDYSAKLQEKAVAEGAACKCAS